jgi:hypothetical protein
VGGHRLPGATCLFIKLLSYLKVLKGRRRPAASHCDDARVEKEYALKTVAILGP